MRQPGDHLTSLKTIVTVVYALQALSFVVGFTFLIAAIISYVKREDAHGTWLASHFRWQIRTFWFALLWTLAGAVLLGFGVGYLILMGAAIWLTYRIVKGWLRLQDGKPMDWAH